ncbi:MAG: hypothetical protein O3B03_00985 [Proteobacteria bacterium]|nr:hypothetical protein [Pseudomonadota bacterium]MDA1331059.1 hypothetical protein [Pseudomonadota bacterium]
MDHAVRITYYISEEMLDFPSENEFEMFIALLSEELSDNWPNSQIFVERCLDGEEGSLIEGMTVHEEEEAGECIEYIVDDLIESLQWESEFDDED